MFTRKIKIEEIRNRLIAIDHLQEASQDDDAIDLLRKLANDILFEVGQPSKEGE
jgi:hypothetical protein